jgi:hypothetical protein
MLFVGSYLNTFLLHPAYRKKILAFLLIEQILHYEHRQLAHLLLFQLSVPITLSALRSGKDLLKQMWLDRLEVVQPIFAAIAIGIGIALAFCGIVRRQVGQPIAPTQLAIAWRSEGRNILSRGKRT